MDNHVLLERAVRQAREQYPKSLSDDKVFEMFCAENILVNYDLDYEEIERGIVDGARDAGVDGLYVFVNRVLVSEDFSYEGIRGDVQIDLVILQAKNQASFKESAVDKLASALPLLLDSSKPESSLQKFASDKLVFAIKSFHTAVDSLGSEFPTVTIKIYYCTKGEEPGDAVKEKANSLAQSLSKSFPTRFTLLGADPLYVRARQQRQLVRELPTVGSPLSAENSYVALCRLHDYRQFITENGELLSRMFDANVRAYQGETEVNKEISKSIANPNSGLDFWWLNNGVTIIADQAQFMNNKLTIRDPLIVNGLQTSNEIYSRLQHPAHLDGRSILVRVIVDADQNQAKRDEIIRATNRQTFIKPSSFRATEDIHKRIEDYFLTLNLYYDRRKNFYKRDGRSVDRVFSIDRLAQAVLALVLQKPHEARARPTTAIKSDHDYNQVFGGHDLEVYGVSARLMAFVEEHFRDIAHAGNQMHRTNLRFHVLMTLGWTLNGHIVLPSKAVAKLPLHNASPNLVWDVTNWVFKNFDDAGADDKIAKQVGFTEYLKNSWTPAISAHGKGAH